MHKTNKVTEMKAYITREFWLGKNLLEQTTLLNYNLWVEIVGYMAIAASIFVRTASASLSQPYSVSQSVGGVCLELYAFYLPGPLDQKGFETMV